MRSLILLQTPCVVIPPLGTFTDFEIFETGSGSAEAAVCGTGDADSEGGGCGCVQGGETNAVIGILEVGLEVEEG